MTTDITAINNKINKYIYSHPELAGQSREYIVSIMLKELALTQEEAKLLEQPSIYSNPFGKIDSILAMDNFMSSNSGLKEPSSAANNNSLPIPNIKTNPDGEIDKNQFSVKELLKQYEPPEYKIDRKAFADSGETICITDNKGNIVFFFNDFNDGSYSITKYDKNTEYKANIANNHIHDCQIKKKLSNGEYTITNFNGIYKNSETHYDKNDKQLHKTNFIINNIKQNINNTDTTSLKDSILNKISSANIEEMLKDYKSDTNSDLINDIVNNPNLNSQEKDLLISHLAEQYHNEETGVKTNYSYFFNQISEDIEKDDIKNLITHVQFIDNDKASEIITELKQGKPLNDDMKLQIYALFTDYDPDYTNNNSHVSNKYYNGDPYSVKQNKDFTISLRNKATGKKTTLDLKKVCKDVPLKYQPQFFDVIQKLPAEVLEDMAYEASFTIEDLGLDGSGRSYFDADDKINISLAQITPNVIVHELGHAIDYNTKYKTVDEKDENAILFASEETSINTIYNKEREAYIAKGLPVHEEGTVFDRETQSWTPVISDGPYCTFNVNEAYAEAYGLLMLGEPSDSQSIECFENHLCGTLSEVKKDLVQKRKKAASERH